MPRRSKPLLIASFIPPLVAFRIIAADRLHGTRLLPVFVFLSALTFLVLLVYVISKTLDARRARAGR